MENKDDQSLFLDELKLYFGEDYTINDYITIHHPTIGEIIEFGERKYYSTVRALTCIPSEMKSRLWDMGVDYSTLTDYELFLFMTRNLTKEDTSIFFGELDLSKLIMDENKANKQIVLYDEKHTNIIIDILAYSKITNFINKINGISHKVEKPATETVKKLLITVDRQEINKNQSKDYTSQLRPMISAMMRYPGFKYKKSELRECGIFEFMDTYLGAQIYISSIALLQGSYSGMVDTSKINTELFDWTRMAITKKQS